MRSIPYIAAGLIVSAGLIAYYFCSSVEKPTATTLGPTSQSDQAIQVSTSITLKLSAPKAVIQGSWFQIVGRLTNTSDKPQWVIKPGDGSESGWREPDIYLTGEQQYNGAWVPLTRRVHPRCGTFDTNWRKDVVHLQPGESIDLENHLLSLPRQLEMKNPGLYRFRLHYVYNAGQKVKFGLQSDPPESMKDVRPFEVISNSVEMEVTVSQPKTEFHFLRDPATLEDIDAMKVVTSNIALTYEFWSGQTQGAKRTPTPTDVNTLVSDLDTVLVNLKNHRLNATANNIATSKIVTQEIDALITNTTKLRERIAADKILNDTRTK